MDIFASKLFKASSRQDKIRSAIENPINAKLVKQIVNYVDPQYKQYTENGEDAKEDAFKDAQEEFMNNETSEDADFESESSTRYMPRMSSGANGRFDAPQDTLKQDFDDTFKDSGSDAETVEPTVNDDEVSESVKIDSVVDTDNSLSSDELDSIKDSLENSPSTSGVARVQLKDEGSELWVYYNDKTNLNSIMENVISVLDKTYKFLDFNRLARTDNAIVFTIG